MMSVVSIARTNESILMLSRTVNDYFMKQWPDPTIATHVKKIRPSHLWTRAVYYEGLMALYSIDAQQRYIDYIDRWADYHQWTARDGSIQPMQTTSVVSKPTLTVMRWLAILR